MKTQVRESVGTDSHSNLNSYTGQSVNVAQCRKQLAWKNPVRNLLRLSVWQRLMKKGKLEGRNQA